MSVLSLRAKAAIEDRGSTVAKDLLFALAAGRADRTLDLVASDFSIFGQSMQGKALQLACREFASLGGLAVRAIHTAPDGAIDAVPAGARDTVFAGAVADADDFVIATCVANGTEFSLGLLIDAQQPTRPKVRRIFDAVPFADAIAATSSAQG